MNIWSILIAVVCVIAAAALLATRYKVQLPKRDAPEDKHGAVASHAPATAPAKAHGDHGHDEKEKKAGPLTWAVSILLLVAGLAYLGTWLIEWDKGNRNQMMANRYLYFAPASSVPSDQPAPPPPSAIDCKDEDLAAAIIEPREEVIVRTVPGTVFWFTPDTDEGTITLCDYFNPGICSSSEERRTIATSAFLVKNVSRAPVSFYCEHRQPS